MNNKNIKYTDINIGLTSKEVESRKVSGLVNHINTIKTKSIKRILLDNLITLFNIINILLAILLIFVSSYKNMAFILLIICNVVISIAQEIHSKKVVDKLSLISSSKIKVLRDSTTLDIDINEIVLDDLILLSSGNQIITDLVILDGNIEVNESFITGEAEPVYKQVGDTITSGSFVICGKCSAQVIHIGDENYTSKIYNGAKYIKKTNSEILCSLNKIVKFASLVIIPVGIFMFLNQMQISNNNITTSIVSSVAAIIGMIPEGLILLVSTVLAVSVIYLSRKKVLIQDLYCIESLARVDTLCLDKTGTITEGKMEIFNTIEVDATIEQIKEALSYISCYSVDTNSTMLAIKEQFTSSQKLEVTKNIPFSSDKKYSAITFKNKGTYIIGAPEVVLAKKIDKYKSEIDEYITENRVIVLVHSNEDIINKVLPNDLEVMGFILIRDTIREDAASTLNYFKEQGVNIKIISGDNAVTVSNIAKRVGLDNYENYIDASILKTDEELFNAANNYTIFGRVSPIQKKKLILALKENGHTVAMTGDGVNDVLALKESDCSIAIGNGSDAARSVSQLILLDSNFASMPYIVAQGRQTINNIERSATLFLSKTIYSTLIAFLFLFINTSFPYIPIQLTLINAVAIGIPSFLLALEPNKNKIKGKFLSNVLKNALPSGILVVLNILIILLLKKTLPLSNIEYSSLSVIMTGIVGMILLFKICFPINKFRGTVFFTMLILFISSLSLFNNIIDIIVFRENVLLITLILTIFSIISFYFITKICNKILNKK